jgi:hypothetical protein
MHIAGTLQAYACVCVCVFVRARALNICVFKGEATSWRGMGSEGTAPGTANVDSRWRQLRNPQHNLYRSLGEPHSLEAVEEKMHKENLPIRQLVACYSVCLKYSCLHCM